MGITVCKPTSVTVTGTGATSTINSKGSVTFDVATAITLNGVFSATYENYMVSIRSVDSSGTTPYMYLRFASSGTANSDANSYDAQYANADGTTRIASRSESTSGMCGGSSSASRDGNTVYIFGPYKAEYTVWRGVGMYGESQAVLHDTAGIHQVATSYDGLYITPLSGTITGLITVYGFNQ